MKVEWCYYCFESRGVPTWDLWVNDRMTGAHVTKQESQYWLNPYARDAARRSGPYAALGEAQAVAEGLLEGGR